MVDQTFRFLLAQQMNFELAGFVFFSTLCSYSFHWHLTSHSVLPSQRIAWLQRNRSVHLTLFVIGLTGAIYFFLQLVPYLYWLLIAAIITFLYSAPKIPNKYFRALRKVAIGKTIFLAFMWMYVTSILPVIVSGQDWSDRCTFFAISRFFLIYAICILFDYRDRQDDKAAGIRSLITWLSEKNISRLFIFSLLVFTIATLFLLSFYHYTAILLLLAPGIITGLLYNHARHHFSDMLYYFVLDGLMALSAMLMLVAVI
jgi:4-hydroxybenzoate polyprenyltransferase